MITGIYLSWPLPYLSPKKLWPCLCFHPPPPPPQLISDKSLMGCTFAWENSYRREFHTAMTFWFRIAFTWWLSHFISRYLKVHFMLIKYMCDSKSQTLRMCYPFQSTSRPISHRNLWSFRVYLIPLRDFAPQRNSCLGNNSEQGILCETQKTVNTWKISGMLIVWWPIMLRKCEQTSKPQTNYRLLFAV